MLLQESKIYYWEIEVIMFIINIGGPGDQAVTVIVLRPTPNTHLKVSVGQLAIYLSGLPQNKPGSPDIAEKRQKVTVNTNKPNNKT